jgi:hypothetical protein
MTATDTIIWPKPRGVTNIDEDALDCWSVTSILSTLNSYGLNIWFQQQVARTAYARRGALQSLTEDEAVQILTRQSNWQRPGYELSARDLGSEVHRAVENYILNNAQAGKYHDEAAPLVAQFHAFVAKFQPRFLAAEMTVYDPTYRYAGTADAIVEFADGKRYLLDWKTTRESRDKQGHVRSPYSEWALQLAAYKRAPFALPVRVDVPEAEQGSPRHYYITKEQQAAAVPMPDVDGCAIVQLTPVEWRLWPVRVDADATDAFLFLREVSRFVEVIAKRSVFGSYVEGTA